MGTFPDTAPIPTGHPGPGPFPPGPPAAPSWPAGTGPKTVQNFAPSPAGGGALTLQALMDRQKAAALAQQQNMSQPQGTILGGLGQVAGSVFNALNARKAEREQQQGTEEIVNAIASIDPATGVASPEILAAVGRRDPDLMLKLWQGAMDARQAGEDEEQWTPIPTPKGENGQWFQNQNGDTKKVGGGSEGSSGPKYTDVASMAQDFSDTPDVKAYQISQPRWISMQDAAQRDDAQSDLTMIIDSAKLSDPGSVVMTSEGEKVVATGGATDHLAAWFKYMTGTPGARLSKNVRLGLLREGYNRMNSYYRGVQSATEQYTERAKRWNFEPADVVRQFAAPTPFDPEKVLGGAGVDTPPETPAPSDTPQNDAAPTTEPDGTIGSGTDNKEYIVKNGRWVPLVR